MLNPSLDEIIYYGKGSIHCKKTHNMFSHSAACWGYLLLEMFLVCVSHWRTRVGNFAWGWGGGQGSEPGSGIGMDRTARGRGEKIVVAGWGW